MMSALNPGLNARVALRYSLLMFPISMGCCYFGMTSWTFLFASSTVNGLMSLRAYEFYKNQNASTARKLFFSSLIHLPVFLILLLATKE